MLQQLNKKDIRGYECERERRVHRRGVQREGEMIRSYFNFKKQKTKDPNFFFMCMGVWPVHQATFIIPGLSYLTSTYFLIPFIYLKRPEEGA